MANKMDADLFSEEDLEKFLHGRLQPVKPRPEFVNKVNRRITRDPSVMLEPTTDESILYIILFGLIAGFITLWIFRLFRK
jgi:hypothetical protein